MELLVKIYLAIGILYASSIAIEALRDPHRDEFISATVDEAVAQIPWLSRRVVEIATLVGFGLSLALSVVTWPLEMRQEIKIRARRKAFMRVKKHS